MVDEGFDANNRVVTPIVGRTGLPKGDTSCQHRAVKYGGKLYKTTKESGLAYGNRHGLNQAGAGIGLHSAHHAQQTGATHYTVGVQYDHMFVVFTPALQKLGDVPDFSMQVFLATTIENLFA